MHQQETHEITARLPLALFAFESHENDELIGECVVLSGAALK